MKELATNFEECSENLKCAMHHIKCMDEVIESSRMICEHMIKNKEKWRSEADMLDQSLSHFKTLDFIKNKCQSLIHTQDLVQCLDRLDESIDFMENHKKYKNSMEYLSQFDCLRNKLLNTIKNRLIRILESCLETVQTYSLEVSELKKLSKKLESLMGIIAIRLTKSQEYKNTYAILVRYYCSTRWNKLSAFMKRTMQNLLAESSSNPTFLIRAGLTFLVRIYNNENEILYSIFSCMPELTEHFFRTICNEIYDLLHSYCIHISEVNILANFCTIIQTEFVIKNIIPISSKDQKADSIYLLLEHIEMLLGDIQEKLIHRSQAMVYKEIFKFDPKESDLNYPDNLFLKPVEYAKTPLDYGNQTKVDDFFIGTVKHVRGCYFPVSTSIDLMNVLFSSLSTPSFELISKEVIESCIQSIKNASNVLEQKKGLIHSQLFAIKHLFLIREELRKFKVSFITNEVVLSFGSLTNAARVLYEKKSNILSLNTNNSLLEFLLEISPQFIDQAIDCKQNLEWEISERCEILLKAAFQILLEDIIKVKNEMNQQTSDPINVKLKIYEAMVGIKAKYLELGQLLSLYVNDEPSEAVILRSVKASISEFFEQLQKQIISEYNDEFSKIVHCPSGSEIFNLLD